MERDDRRRELMRAYAEASNELRRRHDAEFHDILQDIYVERNLTVRKRRSRQQAKQARIDEARRLLAASSNTD